MLLESDQLEYDYDKATALGGRRRRRFITTATAFLGAKKVTYNQKEPDDGRRKSKNVRIVDRTGTVINAETIDITQDFANGFVTALKLDTASQTHFAAEKALRKDGETTTFYRGVYTAREPLPEEAREGADLAGEGGAHHRRPQGEDDLFPLGAARVPGHSRRLFPGLLGAGSDGVKRKSGFLFPVPATSRRSAPSPRCRISGRWRRTTT